MVKSQGNETMQSYKVKQNDAFIGRKHEIKRLDDLLSRNEASFLVVYGRRRVGKTELIEQYFRNRCVFKFEGIESDSDNVLTTKAEQISNCSKRLAKYMENPIIAKAACNDWTDFFELIDDVASKENVVLYFEEIQWLVGYKSDFFAQLKPFWDDSWRHNKNLVLVLCGSSVSFIVNQFLSNKALYSRAQEEIHLKPFNFIEIGKFLPNFGKREQMVAQLTVGGICEYLKQVKGKGTLLTNLCRKSFLPNSFFAIEYEKIFVSSLATNRYYKSVIEFLAKNKFAEIKDLEKACRVKSGGHLTEVLVDLEKCGFIQKYVPLHKNENSKLLRYTIDDEYLLFYYRFIRPIEKCIKNGDYNEHPEKALNRINFNQIMGYSFERWCRKNHYIFARIMGFNGVAYESGTFFDRKSCNIEKGFQIDLMYIINGSKIIFCEIKYDSGSMQSGVYEKMISRKNLFLQSMPKYSNYTFEMVLITAEKPTNEIDDFDLVITLDEISNEQYW